MFPLRITSALALGFTVSTLMVAASPTPGALTDPSSQCNTGPVQCCNSVQTVSNNSADFVKVLATLLGIGAGIPVGLTCSPITAGVESNHCNAGPVCCSGNNYKGGLVVVGCSPISL